MRRLLLSIAALLIAGGVSAQPLGVRVFKDTTNARIMVRSDDGTVLGVYGSGAPSFTTFLGDNIPAGAIFFNTANGSTYYFGSGSWTVSSGGSAASIVAGTTTAGTCASKFVVGDASNILQCPASLVASTGGAGNGVLTFRDTTLAAGSDTAGFLTLSGTLLQTTSGTSINGVNFAVTPVGSASVIQRGMQIDFKAGYSGGGMVQGLRVNQSSVGTSTDYYSTSGGNYGARAESNGTTAGTNVGVMGYAAGGTESVGVFGDAPIDKASGTNIGVVGNARNNGGSSFEIGGMFTNGFVTEPTLGLSVALLADNMAEANPIFVARDSGALLPTTGATATTAILDGAWLQAGNGVLTSATMTAETQARQSGSLIHSYTWTNAQVVALGAGLTGDITVATLPAKTQVRNAYIVITGQAAGVTTLTVSCGDAIGGTPFINYVVASDAKAAVNTVYGDAVAERGTSLDVEFYYLPSYTATTLVTCHFISTVNNLDQTTGSTGRVILETTTLP